MRNKLLQIRLTDDERTRIDGLVEKLGSFRPLVGKSGVVRLAIDEFWIKHGRPLPKARKPDKKGR